MESVDRIDVDLEKIDRCLQQLMNFDRATSYAKQKDSLRKEFETFLRSIPGYVTFETVTPHDICWFLVLKTRMERPRYTEMGLRILAKKEDLAVDVFYVCHTKQWILMLANF